jgi:hypothetical protein
VSDAQTCTRPPIEAALSRPAFGTPSYASRASLPLRRDGHTKVYCGRSEEVMRPHARVMEEPTQIADCVTQQRRCSGCALFGRASHIAGVSCAITIWSPMGSSR